MYARLLLISALCVCGNAFAWGPQGHQVIGAISDQLLTPNAAQKLHEVLGMELRVAATWADCVKDVAKNNGFAYKPDPRFHAACAAFETSDGIDRMVDYVSRNFDSCPRQPSEDPCHKQYHHTDVTIQHSDYDPAFAGTSDHDAVAAINAAIAVLQGNPAPAYFSIKDEKEAVLMLAHLVGDLHQPLHVGAVYIDGHNKPTNPTQQGIPWTRRQRLVVATPSMIAAPTCMPSGIPCRQEEASSRATGQGGSASRADSQRYLVID